MTGLGISSDTQMMRMSLMLSTLRSSIMCSPPRVCFSTSLVQVTAPS